METLEQQLQEVRKAWLDLWYQVGKELGIISVIKKIPFLQLKQWVKEREDNEA